MLSSTGVSEVLHASSTMSGVRGHAEIGSGTRQKYKETNGVSYISTHGADAASTLE